MKWVYIGTGTQWDRYTVEQDTLGQVHSGTGTYWNSPKVVAEGVAKLALHLTSCGAAMRDSLAAGPFVWTLNLGDICDLRYVSKFRLNLVLCELYLPRKGIVLLVLCLVHESLPCSH